MRRGSAVPFVLCAVLISATPARGEDPATYDLSRRDRWVTGDVVTTSIVEKDSQSFRITAPPAPAAEEKRESLLTATLVRKCLLADAAGIPVRMGVYVKDWTLDNGRTKDTSLAGARLEARTIGKERKYGLVANGPAGPVSAAARSWLDGEMGPGSPDPDVLRAAWLPTEKVAVGAEWTTDLGPLLDGPQWSAKPVDRARATSISRLQDVKGEVATVVNKASIPLTSVTLKGAAEPLPWTKGGAWDRRGELTVALSGRLAGESRWVTGVLEGEAVKAGKTIALTMKYENRRVTTIGGEFPADPAPPAPPEPPPMSDPAPMDGAPPPR